MKKHCYHILLLLILAITLFGIMYSCYPTTNKSDVLLERAERCMEAHPDSALLFLDSIDNSFHLKKEPLARYYLLLTQARDKNYMDLSADSSIIYSVNYFEKSGDRARYAKSLYYYGRVIQMCDDQLRAMQIYLNARPVLEETKEYKTLGLMSEDMSIFNRNLSFYGRSVEYARDAIHFYTLAGDTLGVAYAHQTLGRAFFMLQELDSVLKHSSISLQICSCNPVRLRLNASKLFALVYSKKGEFAVAERILMEMINEEPNEEKKPYHYVTLGHLYVKQGKIQAARKYLTMSLSGASLFTRSDAYSDLADLARQENNYSEYFSLKAKADSLLNVAENNEKREKISRLQIKYAEEHRLRENMQMKLEKRNILFTSLMAFLLLSASLYYLYQKYFHAKLQIKKATKRLEKNKVKITYYKEQINRYKRQQKDMDAISDAEIKSLTQKIAELTADSSKLRANLDICVLIRQLKNGDVIAEHITSEEWNRLFGLVNNLFHDVLIRIKKKYSNLTNHDMRLLTFLLLGFSGKELITLFDSKNSHTLTKAKQRLKARLGLKAGDSLDDFLQDCKNNDCF